MRLPSLACLAFVGCLVSSVVLACGGSTSDAEGDAGADAASTTFTPPPGYDEGCARDEDCVAIQGAPCVECPACFPDVAVSKAKLDAYDAKKRAVQCPPRDPVRACPGAPCNAADAVYAACASAKCVLRKLSERDAGADADSGG
ncbi:MAG: hypothetical protein JST00_36550 [Deltaproteobacteria bacterium]|nr:hypothetical protein [Deltaproteobacteria bacterium]